MIPTKTCKGPCGRELPLGRFGLERRNKDGHKGKCLDCAAEHHARWKAQRRYAQKRSDDRKWKFEVEV